MVGVETYLTSACCAGNGAAGVAAGGGGEAGVDEGGGLCLEPGIVSFALGGVGAGGRV